METLEDVAFARMTESEVACALEKGEIVEFAEGEVIFAEGERDFPFYVVLDGAVEISESTSCERRSLTTHLPGAFMGDIDLLTDRVALVTATASKPSRLIRIERPVLREALCMTDEVSARLLDAFIARRTLLRGTGFAGVRLVGSGDDQRTQELLEFLYKNHVPFSLHDPATAEGAQALECLGTDKPRLPAVLHAEYAAERPEVSEVASALGILHPVGEEPYDLVVVGAGPSGLAATVYAASEGVRTLTVDRLGPGGQAASSSRIENFIGFPTGISGADLASRGYLQALKFGARFAIPASVESLAPDGDEFVRMALSTGETVRARAALITSGVYYRRLPLENGHDFTGSGVYYSATSVQAVACRESTAVVVGGGNSAGQAAMYLSQHASRVIMTIRSGNLAASMSAYLRERIDRTPNIEIRYHTEVKDLRGDHALRGVTLEQNKTGEREDLDCAGVFVFIGARPNTEWLPDAIALDERGYVLTGPQASASGWPLEREPCVLETSMARVLAGGDIRSGTTKRCGFAVGDGSLAVSCVHTLLGGV